jgi:hypothetical protein
MQHEHEQIQFDDLAEVLKGAQLRRSADLGKWLREFFHGRRRQALAELHRPSGETAAA